MPVTFGLFKATARFLRSITFYNICSRQQIIFIIRREDNSICCPFQRKYQEFLYLLWGMTKRFVLRMIWRNSQMKRHIFCLTFLCIEFKEKCGSRGQRRLILSHSRIYIKISKHENWKYNIISNYSTLDWFDQLNIFQFT